MWQHHWQGLVLTELSMSCSTNLHVLLKHTSTCIYLETKNLVNWGARLWRLLKTNQASLYLKSPCIQLGKLNVNNSNANCAFILQELGNWTMFVWLYLIYLNWSMFVCLYVIYLNWTIFVCLYVIYLNWTMLVCLYVIYLNWTMFVCLYVIYLNWTMFVWLYAGITAAGAYNFIPLHGSGLLVNQPMTSPF